MDKDLKSWAPLSFLGDITMANQTKNASFCTLGVCGKVFVGMRLKRATCFLPAMRLGPTLCSSSSFACLCCGIAKPTLSMWREVEATIVSSSFMLQQRKGFLTYQDFQKGMERFGYTITEQVRLTAHLESHGSDDHTTRKPWLRLTEQTRIYANKCGHA